MIAKARLAALVAAILPLAAQVAVEIALPQPLGERIARALSDQLGGAGRVEVALQSSLRAEPGSVVVGDWVSLQRLQRLHPFVPLAPALDASTMPLPIRRSLDGTIALPWSLTYCVVEPLAETAEPWSFERLALASELDTGLRMAPPEVDAGPWILSMAELHQQGRPETAIFGLWTALDARIAVYPRDYDSLVAELVQRTATAVVMPSPLVSSPLPGILATMPVRALDGALPIGLVAIDGGDVAASSALVARICEPAVRTAVRERVGLAEPAATDAELSPEMVSPALSHFEQRIRGQGRSVERIADALDYVFLLLFGVVLCVLWFRNRKENPL
ncbi:MAG: hypothetical protein ABL997_01390 [Planctomycetota bacterium]